MKRYLGWLVVAAVAVGIAVSLVALPGKSGWTTSSDEALGEFLAGVEAQQKLYQGEAAGHFERAVALDPDFLVAKMFLADTVRERDQDLASSLVADVLAAPTEALTAREQLLIARLRALHDKRPDDAAALVDAYLVDHPDDPYVLYIKAMSAWNGGDLELAERLNRRLIEIEPNWVIAYNQLGYIAMMQARFVEAEEYFTSYRFVAPDQANPHDSLGELYLIQGRYDEAIASFETALAIRPDFTASYDHLVLAMILLHRFDDARKVSARLAEIEGIPDKALKSLDCTIELAELEAAAKWLDIVARRDDCLWDPRQGYVAVVIHRAAVLTGDVELAIALEDKAQAVLDEYDEQMKWRDSLAAMVLHMRGVRLAVAGERDAAIKLLTEVDERLTYREAAIGLFKLSNRLLLTEIRFAAGQDAEAHKLLSQVRAINPLLVKDFEDHGLHYLGLERR